ncbi:conserved hypothetical protein, partial [Ricinus communis]
MKVDVIAVNLRNAMAATAQVRSYLPGATVMAGGEYAQETAFLGTMRLAEARSLANALGALELCASCDGEAVAFGPVEAISDFHAQPVGNVVVELLEDNATRFAHFWLSSPQGRMRVIIELLPGEGPYMRVTHGAYLNDRGHLVSLGTVTLADDET